MARKQTKTTSRKSSSGKSTPGNKRSMMKGQSSSQKIKGQSASKKSRIADEQDENEIKSQSQQSENKSQQGKSQQGNGKETEGQKKEMGILETVKEIFSPIKPVDKTLEELFEDGLKDMYSAEKQLTKALPKLAEAAYNNELSHAFLQHYSESKKHAQTLEKIMAYLGVNPVGKKCKAMEGLIAEGEDMIRHYNESPVRDSALIIAAQKVEHYEIASYGSLCELADVLGFGKIKDSLGRILEEEKRTDKLLSQLAMDSNDEAYDQASSQKSRKKSKVK